MTLSVAASSGGDARPRVGAEAGEQRLVVSGVSWRDYVALNDTLGVPGLRMFFCEGLLELVTTSTPHERLKTTIARLIEMYAFLSDLRINGYGSATFRSEVKARGAEPDECYVVGGKLIAFPEIVLEVVVTSGGIDKLDVYAGMGVREVWFFENGAFHLHELRDDGYHAISSSALVPGLDVDVLARCAEIEDQHAALAALRAWMQGGAGHG